MTIQNMMVGAPITFSYNLTTSTGFPSSNSINAVIQTLQSDSQGLFAPLHPFYWEIGNTNSTIISGSVGVGPSSGSDIKAGNQFISSSNLSVASASKWIYGTYVAQLRANSSAIVTATDLACLSMTSGYTNMSASDNVCLGTNNIYGCLVQPAAYSEYPNISLIATGTSITANFPSSPYLTSPISSGTYVAITGANPSIYNGVFTVTTSTYNSITGNCTVTYASGGSTSTYTPKYYISTTGNDTHDGLTPQTAWAITSLLYSKSIYATTAGKNNYTLMAGKTIAIMSGTYYLNTIVDNTTFDSNTGLIVVSQYSAILLVPSGTTSSQTIVYSADLNGNYLAGAAVLDGGLALGPALSKSDVIFENSNTVVVVSSTAVTIAANQTFTFNVNLTSQTGGLRIFGANGSFGGSKIRVYTTSTVGWPNQYMNQNSGVSNYMDGTVTSYSGNTLVFQSSSSVSGIGNSASTWYFTSYDYAPAIGILDSFNSYLGYATIDGFTIQNVNGAGINVQAFSSPYTTISNMVIKNNVLNNYITYTSGNNPGLIRIQGLNTSTITNNYLSNWGVNSNENLGVDGEHLAAILSYFGHNNSYTYNTVYNNMIPCMGVKLKGQGGIYDNSNSTLAYNYVEVNCPSGGSLGIPDFSAPISNSTNYVHHNIIWAATPLQHGGLGSTDNNTTVDTNYIYNNVFYNDQTSNFSNNFVQFGSGQSNGINWYNNIFYQPNLSTYTATYYLGEIAAANAGIVNYNSYSPFTTSTNALGLGTYGSSGNWQNGNNNGHYYTFSNWKSTTGLDTNSFAINPNFNTPTSLGSGGGPSTFTLLSGSSLINAGRTGGTFMGSQINIGAWDGTIMQIGSLINTLPVLPAVISSGTSIVPAYATTGTTGTGMVATVYFSPATPGVPAVGSTATITGVTPSGYNGTWNITSSTLNSVTFTSAATGNLITTGTVAIDIYQIINPATQGLFWYTHGHMENHSNLYTPLGGASGPNSGLILNRLGNSVINTIFTSTIFLSSTATVKYTEPLISGGGYMAPQDYRQILQNIINGKLNMVNYLYTPLTVTYGKGSGFNAIGSTSTGGPFGGAVPNQSPILENWYYSFGHWVESDPLTNGDGACSSPGAFGFYPWIEPSLTYYGMLDVDATGGSGLTSYRAGRLLRRAWMTGLAQTGTIPTPSLISSPLVLTTASIGVTYTNQFNVITTTTNAIYGGTTAPYTWSVKSRSGQNTWSIGTSTGILTGTPAYSEVDALVVTVTDSAGKKDSNVFYVYVSTSTDAWTLDSGSVTIDSGFFTLDG